MSKTIRLLVVVLIHCKYRSKEDYSRALDVRRRLEFLCRKYSIRYIDPWATFFRKDNLFQTDSTHFSSLEASLFARHMKSRLFNPVAARSRGPERAGHSAPLAGASSKGAAAKRAPPKEDLNLVANVPPPRSPLLVLDLV